MPTTDLPEQTANYNLGHILKSLVYFDDAESGKEKLIMLKEVKWNKVKEFFKSWLIKRKSFFEFIVINSQNL